MDRGVVATPKSFADPSAAVRDEATLAVAYYKVRLPWTGTHTAYNFECYRPDDVKNALRALAGGNCAYCESKIGAVGAAEVEHYRPKGGVANLPAHPGYWWLALAWENLLPTCRDCNKSLRQHIVQPGMTRAEVEALLDRRARDSHGKAEQFDILGTRAVGATCNHDVEDPLLINPCSKDPSDHLKWDFAAELTLIEPAPTAGGFSRYGAYTIKTCALNRAKLVLDRIAPMRLMRSLRDDIFRRLNRWSGNQSEFASILESVNVLAEFAKPDAAYAGMAAAYIREVEDEIGRWRIQRGFPAL